ncbi:non-ribosomal peptide synthetase [Rhodococcus erythropolis]|uniref:non-ribosomal peptide synthetase n=1 Tax=Rhodococcus erythropolis TaxID=1833 RepID=UPI004043C0DA
MSVSVPTLTELRETAAAMLDLPVAEVGLEDNLIECGLQSIQMINLAAELRRNGIEVVFADFALDPTIKAWHDLLKSRVRITDDTSSRPDGSATPDVESSPAADDHERFKLATMQHAYWIGRRDDQQLGGVAAHLYAEFDGPDEGSEPVDPDRMRTAVDALVERHVMLRSVFDDDGYQRVPTHPESEIFTVVDLRNKNADTVALELECLREKKTHQRMPADAGKVADITLTLLPDGKHRLHVDIDMLAADALSYRILMADLAEIYRGNKEYLPPIDYSYRRYLADKPALTGAARERDRQWWSEHLDELPDPPTLPIVPEHERENPHHTIRCNHWIDAAAKQTLIERSHRYGVTPAVVLAAVFAHIVSGWSRDREFLLNVPLFDREPTHSDVELLSGDFSSSIMLAVDGSHQNFLELIRDLQCRLHTYASHSAYPGLDVLRDLGRHRGGQLLAPVVYTSGLDLGELFRPSVTEEFGQPVWIVSQGPQVVLDAQVVELDGGLLTNWDVREQAFPPGVMDAMFTRHRAVIDRLVGDNADWNFTLNEPTPPEQIAVREHTNAGPDDRAQGDLVIHKGFFRNADLSPDAIAIVDEHDVAHSYAEVAEQALTISSGLRERGIGTGDVVAIRLPKGADQIVAVLAILATGAAYLPIGHDQPPARIRRMYDIAGAALEISGSALDGADVPVRMSIDELEQLGRSQTPVTPVFPDPDALAYVMFTSGSTGDPKGVELPHAAVANTLAAMNRMFDLNATDRSIALSALEFDLSVQETLGLFAVGGSTVAVTEEVRRDGHAAAKLIGRHQVTQLYCVPAVLDVVLAGGTQLPGWSKSVRVVILGGDWVRPELLRRMYEAAPQARLAGLGGATETAIHHTVCEVDGANIDPRWHSIPFGKPLAGVAARIVNDRGQDCPDWVSGELWIGGAGLAAGYRGDDERTAERFVEYGGLRWYRTGDTARYWPDGTIEFLGRRDDQVKVRGFRIELGEIEAALRSLPTIDNAVATVIAGRLAATITAVAPHDATVPDQILASLADRLPTYMIPTTLEVVDEFPRTSNGKIDRAAIARHVHQRLSNNDYVAPETALEKAVASLFGYVVGGDRVGACDEFFDIGGDSVLATSLVARLRDVLQSESITVSDIFKARTPRALATHLEATSSDAEHIRAVAEVFVEVLEMSEEELEQLDRDSVSTNNDSQVAAE